MKKLIAGNWKMNGIQASLEEVARLVIGLDGGAASDRDLLICPPATLLAKMAEEFSDVIFVGGQNCHERESGAHTGDVSAEMLADAGASYVIVGHSERRADHHEVDSDVKAKAMAARRAGLTPIVCVGESEAQRGEGEALNVVGAQLSGSLPEEEGELVIAYEPVWAIGTGLTPTLGDIAEMHGFIRDRVGSGVRILYGGSVKPGNAHDILAIKDVNGALVGGASLKASDFLSIVSAG